MAKVNVERVKTLLGEVKKSLGFLRELATMSEEEVVGDPLRLGTAKYYLIVVIQSCIDLCNHIVAKGDARAPADYGDCFKVLAEINILSFGLSERMMKMAKLRNLLVHRYWEVDESQVYRILVEELGVFDEFAKTIAGYAPASIEKGAV